MADELFNVASYKAPEIVSEGPWYNTGPLKLAELKGKVVLIDFWTYSCINCIRSLPFVRAWYKAYKDSGFVVIGVHAPEFEFEKMPQNVERAVHDYKLEYPVVQDNNLATWSAFANHYWPAHYLIDKEGRVRREHFGEGEYDQTEKAIRTLLEEAGNGMHDDVTVLGPVSPPISREQTPETYLGYERGRNFANAAEFAPDKTVAYTLMDELDEHDWTLGGSWKVGPMGTVAEGEGSTLRIKFSAKDVYLVMDGPMGTALTMTVNGKAVTNNQGGGADVGQGGRVVLDGARLYKIISLPTFARGAVLDVSIPKGSSVMAFTFGS